jgi:hypothetical protein
MANQQQEQKERDRPGKAIDREKEQKERQDPNFREPKRQDPERPERRSDR